MSQSSIDQSADVPAPTASEAAKVFLKIGCLSFGGPAGQIALMHRELVDERRWLPERQFLSALNFCMLLPGPEAMQLATYAGWRLHGVTGGLVAGLLFVLPGALLMAGLALGYALYGAMPVVQAAFLGIKGAVLAIVIEALLRVARRALKGRFDWAVAAASFVLIAALQVPFPMIVIGAALLGFLFRREAPSPPTLAEGGRVSAAGQASLASTFKTIAIWLLIWIVPLVVVGLALGRYHVVTELAIFFSKLAVVTFGGAYAVLAYMGQAVVGSYGWLQPGEMLDALGLAETTPGPLILVTEFVGVIAAFRHGGGDPVFMGLLGGLVTLWATFAPCFLWIFAGAPHIERLTAIPALRSALAAVTAAVVGVILSLTLWFAKHVLFAETGSWTLGLVHLDLPVLSSVRLDQVGIAAIACVLIFALHRGVVLTLGVCAGLGLALWGLGFGA